MSVTRQQLIATARTYLGLPYRTQGRDRLGVDCGGLFLVIGRELGLTELEWLGYANSPDGATFERLLNENCDPVMPFDQPQVGDILAADYGEGVQHTMMATELLPRLKVIHAKRQHGVIEQYIHGRDLRGWSKTYRIRGVAHE
jgi:cell wall-associated NlpC family hydrolase